MDGLNKDQRALAWIDTYDPSFIGKAILNKDFTFRTVNHQLCEILGMTTGELIDKHLIHFTKEPQKAKEDLNLFKMAQNKVSAFCIEKTFVTPSGEEIEVAQMVCKIPKSAEDIDFAIVEIVAKAPANSALSTRKSNSLWDKILVLSTLVAYAAYELVLKKLGG